MWPPLEGAEPIAAYAGLRPAGRGVNYLIEPSPCVPRPRQRGSDPLDRPDGIARDRGIRLRASCSDWAWRLRSERPLEPGTTPQSRVPWWRRAAEYRSR